MGRACINGLAICLVAGTAWPQSEDRALQNHLPQSRTVLGGGNEFLSAGAEAIRFGAYKEGIELTTRGLESGATPAHDRSAALSNLCAAYAASGDPDTAIVHCTESLALNSGNWRAFSNRAYAFWLKGQYAEARFDVDAAAAINPRARQIAAIRGMINEASLQPRITTEDHQ